MSILQSAISKAKAFGELLHRETDAAEVTVARREALALSLLQQSLDVNDGIIILLEANDKGVKAL